MVQLLSTIFISVELAHHEIFRKGELVKGGIIGRILL